MLGRWVAIALAASAVFAGCVASGDQSGVSKTVAASNVAAPKAAEREQAPTPTTLTPTTTVATAPSPSARTRAPRIAAAARPRPAATGRPATPGKPSSPTWQRFEGRLTGGTYYVGRARGGGLAVSPSPDAAPAATLSNPLPSGAPRVVVVTQDPGGDWLQVLLPMRPNASLGWVRRGDVEVSTVHHRVEIDRAAHRLRVFDGAENVVADEPVAVGKPSTPTPQGQFFTVELLQPPNPGGAYGPYAFTLSAYSEVYQTFGSGDGAVGMHGTNEPSSIGRDASHGCIRLNNGAIQRLAALLPLGAPVFIR